MPTRIYGSFVELAADITGTDPEDYDAVDAALMEKWEFSLDTLEEVGLELLRRTIPQQAPLSGGLRHVFAVKQQDGIYRSLVGIDAAE